MNKEKNQGYRSFNQRNHPFVFFFLYLAAGDIIFGEKPD